MPYTQVVTTGVPPGDRFEVDILLTSGDIIAVRNNDYAYDQVQQWGVLMLGDYNLFDGGNVLFNSQTICYHKAHSIRVPVGYPEAQFPAIYIQSNYPIGLLNLTVFTYAP